MQDFSLAEDISVILGIKKRLRVISYATGAFIYVAGDFPATHHILCPKSWNEKYMAFSIINCIN